MLKIRTTNKLLAFIILIGGRSNRFGTDKCFFLFNQKSLLDYQLEILSKFPYDIFLIANSKKQVQDCFNKINYEKITAFILDDYDLLRDPQIRTPLIGIYSALKELKELGYKKSFVLPCDLPFIRYNVIEMFISNCKTYDCCIPQWKNGFLEPLFAIYPVKKAYTTSSLNLKKGNYKLSNILSQDWKTHFISIEEEIKKIDPELLTFKNINNPEDLNALN